MYRSRKKMESVPINPYIGVLTDSATLGQMARRSQPYPSHQFPGQLYHQSSLPNQLPSFNQQQFLISNGFIDPVDQFSTPAQIIPANQLRRSGQVSFDPRTTIITSSGGKNGRLRHQQQRATSAPAPVVAAAAVPEFLGPHQDMDRGVMGSSEAEFQNDFIEVFPMRHLEPKPDLE